MVLNYVNTGFFTAVVLVSAVYNLKLNTRESNPRRMLTQIVQNISRVQNVLDKFIKHFEKVDEEYSDQTGEEVVSEVTDISDKITKPVKKLHKPQKGKKVKTRNHGNNNDKTDYNSRTFKSKTSDVREFTMNTSRNVSADVIVRGHRRVNENSNEIQFVPVDLPKKNKNTSDALTEENMPTVNVKALQTTSKLELPAVHDSSLEEEKIAQDEILKAKSLRQSYNEAHMTVIKKKCRTALKTVLKDVCNQAKKKCTEEFTSDFKDRSETGCDTQFNEKSAFCTLGPDYPELGGTAKNSEAGINDKTKLSRAKIDQYEKACNKANYKKCLATCKYAVDETCGKYECDKSIQKAFNKSCQSKCREQYGIGDSDTSSDDDVISNDGDSASWDSVQQR